MATATIIPNKYIYQGQGYLDEKLKSYTTYANLVGSSDQVWNGKFAIVIKDFGNKPALYSYEKYKDGTGEWKLVDSNIIVDKKSDLDSIPRFRQKVGLEAVVVSDEDNDNQISKYWLTGYKDGNPIWERKRYAGDLQKDIDSIINMLNEKKYGNVVYLTYVEGGKENPLCVWVEGGEKKWGTLDEVPSGAELLKKYEEEGMYAILEKDGDVDFEKIQTSEDSIMVGGKDIE